MSTSTWWGRLREMAYPKRQLLLAPRPTIASSLRELDAYEIELGEVCNAIVNGTPYATAGDRLSTLCRECMRVSPSCSEDLSAIAQAHGEVLRVLFRLSADRGARGPDSEHMGRLRLRRAGHSAAVQCLRERLKASLEAIAS